MMNGIIYFIIGCMLQVIAGIMLFHSCEMDWIIVLINIGIFFVLMAAGAIIHKQSQIIDALNHQNAFLIAFLKNSGVEVINE